MVLPGLLLQRVISRVALALVSLLIASGRAETEPTAGTMPEDHLPALKPILAAALQRSPELISREFERMVQEVRVEDARSARLPQVGGSFNYGITQSATRANTSSQDRSSGFYYNFGASQALFHWGALKNQSEATRLSLFAAERGYAQFYRTFSNTVRKAYLALVLEKAAVRQRRAAVEIVRGDREVAEAKFASGTISAAAREGERLRLAEAEFELKKQESDLAINCRRFARLTGVADFDEAAVPDDLPRPVHSEPRAAAMAAAVLRDNARGTLEYEYWDLRVREAELGQKIAATRLLPKFGASINYSLENNTFVNGNAVQQSAVTRESAGIGGNWAIFDGFATRAAKRRALIEKRSAEHQRTQKIEELLEGVQSLERKLKLAAEQLEFAASRRAIAEANHRLITDEAHRGNVPKNAIELARVAVLNAQVKEFEARAAYFGDWSEFVALAGEDPVLNNLPGRYARGKK